MRMKLKWLWLVLFLASHGLVQAQDIKLPADVEKLSAKAKETVEVTMDGPMLRWASKFLSAEDPEEAKCARLVANLKGIYVRSFEFEKEGEYSSADVEALRSQFAFSRLVESGRSPKRARRRQCRHLLQDGS
jgi:hypothetical protein